jgi:DNA-binding MarR family transcriptional regulator
MSRTKTINLSSPQVSELESHLGFWLRFVSNHVSTSFKKRVEANGVSVSEWVALRHLLDQGESTSLELIDALGMTKGAISKIITRLESKRLVERIWLDTDKRTQQIKLTSAGRKLVPKLAALADQNDEEFFGHMTQNQRAQIIKAMKRITELHGLKQLPVE